jgi:DNA-binding transcriptional LysR family regulator
MLGRWRSMGVELKQLRSFVAVAEELNFTAAAHRLYVSQQALSRIIHQLERDLGATLFERTTRSVRLTPAGLALLDSSRRIIAAADEAVTAVQQVAGAHASRPLRVDVSSSGLQTGAEILRRLRSERPDIAVEQVEHGVPHGLAALAEGGLDALVGIATHCPPTLHAELIRREPILAAMAADHPLAALDQVSVADLADVELLLPSEEAAPEWLELVTGYCQLAGFAPRRLPGATHGQAAVIEMLHETRSVTPTAAWSAPPADLAFRPLVEPVPVLPWSIITAPEGKRRAEADALLGVARMVAIEQGWLAPPPPTSATPSDRPRTAAPNR